MKKAYLFTGFWLLLLSAMVLFLPQQLNAPYSYEADTVVVDGPKFLWHLANFDGAHYQNIARISYAKPFLTAFFPLYPLLIRGLAFIIGNYLVSGLLISLFSLLGSTYLLTRLSSTHKPHLMLLAFPLSFFFLTSYTESFFLLLALAVWWSYQQQRYWLTGLLGLLAGLTRFYGVLLIPLLLLDHFFQLKPQKRLQLTAYQKLLPLLLMPLGLLAYMAYLYLNYQDPLLFFHSLAMWQKSTVTFPLQTLYRYLKIFLTVSPSVWQYWVAVLEFFFFFLGLLFTWLLYRRQKYAFSFYVFIGTLIPSLTGTLQSMPRYLLVLFPIYLLADKWPKKILYPLAVLGLILQLLLFGHFLNGQFVA